MATYLTGLLVLRITTKNTDYINKKSLTWFFKYSSIARRAESVNFTNIKSLFSPKFCWDDKPYLTPGQSAAISINSVELCNQLTNRVNSGFTNTKQFTHKKHYYLVSSVRILKNLHFINTTFFTDAPLQRILREIV